jgi:hypothetical protein
MTRFKMITVRKTRTILTQPPSSSYDHNNLIERDPIESWVSLSIILVNLVKWVMITST